MGPVLYVIVAMVSWPLLTGLMFRSFRYDCPLLSARSDFGFALLFAFLASLIWPFGWFMAACVTGFFEGAFSDRARR